MRIKSNGKNRIDKGAKRVKHIEKGAQNVRLTGLT